MVDYTGLENRRTARYRGFESLSLRSRVLQVFDLQDSFFSFVHVVHEIIWVSRYLVGIGE